MYARPRHSLCILLLALAALTVGAACTPAPGRTLRIYTSLPLQTRQGESIRKGIALALTQANWQAGGFTIELVAHTDSVESGQWDADLEQANANEAVAGLNVIAYIGPFNSGAAEISIPITNRGGLAQISPGNTAPALTKFGFQPGRPGEFYPTGRRNYFRTCPTDDVQGAAGALWARQMGFTSVYVLDDGELYGSGIADLFEEKAADLGIQVRGRESIDKRAEDFGDVLRRVAQAQPDLVYFGGVTPNGAPLIVKQMREMGVQATYMVPDGSVDSEFIDKAGPASEDVLATMVGIPPRALTGLGAEFYAAYVAEYGEDPEPFAQFGYDAARVVLAAIERTRANDRKAILDAIAATHGFPGTGGEFSFDRNGDTTLAAISGNRVVNGRFEFVQALMTSAGP